MWYMHMYDSTCMIVYDHEYDWHLSLHIIHDSEWYEILIYDNRRISISFSLQWQGLPVCLCLCSWSAFLNRRGAYNTKSVPRIKAAEPEMSMIQSYTDRWFQPNPLKNLTSSVGVMTVPIYGKHRYEMFQITN